MGDPTSQHSRLTGEGASPYNCNVAMQVLLPGSYSRLQEDISLMWTSDPIRGSKYSCQFNVDRIKTHQCPRV